MSEDEAQTTIDSTPSGRARPGSKESKSKKKSAESAQKSEGEGRGLFKLVFLDYRFWIFVSGLVIGFVLGAI